MTPKPLSILLLLSLLIMPAMAELDCSHYYGHYVKIKVVTEQCPHFGEFPNYSFDSCTYDNPIRNATVSATRIDIPDDIIWLYSFLGMRVNEMRDELTTTKTTDENGESIFLLYSSERYNMAITNATSNTVSLSIVPTESNYVILVKS